MKGYKKRDYKKTSKNSINNCIPAEKTLREKVYFYVYG
jgi:hypothetical protein